MDMRFISTKIHGVLDYIVGLALIVAPMLFGFQEVGGMAVALPAIIGSALILYSLFTNYEWGIFKLINMPSHLIIDIIAAVLLILSPFLFGFINEAPNAWIPHVVVGIVVIILALFSESTYTETSQAS